MKNGYFQLLMTNESTVVRLFPPVDGGENLRIDDIKYYLSDRNYSFDIIELNKVISNLTEPTDFLLMESRGLAETETFILNISADKMSAVARFYAPSNFGASLRKEDIISDLSLKGIKAGINESEIERFLSEKNYCSDYVLASGKKPVQGQDAYVEYFFNTNPDTKPTLNQDGTVDFFNLSVISKCKEGDVLATLHNEVPGEDGYNVVGEPLHPRNVVKKSLHFGRNIHLSEDEMSIISEIDGHVSLTGELVTVTDVYEVNDVDTSTGNIEYTGNVCVLGNVKAGFAVQADGNVEIRGVVEGALVEAKGDIIINRGMNGMGKGMLIAGGNIVSKFIENSKVSAEGYIHSEAIMNSNVTAKGDVTVTGKRGFITGGNVHSSGTVSARFIGSNMGANTEIEVGVDPKLKNRYNALKQQITDNMKKLQQIEPVLVTLTKKKKSGAAFSEEQQKYFSQLATQYNIIKQQLQKDDEELDTLEESLGSSVIDSVVMVTDIAYPGTTIKMGDASLNVSSNTSRCRFVKDGADIRVRAL